MQIHNDGLVRQKVCVQYTQKGIISWFRSIFHGDYNTLRLWREAKSFSYFFETLFRSLAAYLTAVAPISNIVGALLWMPS